MKKLKHNGKDITYRLKNELRMKIDDRVTWNNWSQIMKISEKISPPKSDEFKDFKNQQFSMSGKKSQIF